MWCFVLVVDTMTCTCIVMLISICPLPSCNFLPSMLGIYYGETPLVNRGPRSILLHLIIQSVVSTVLLHSLQTNNIFLIIYLILCFQQASEIDNLTVSLGQSIFLVLCAGSTSTGSVDTFRRTFISYWFDNFGFILRETCCCTHHTFLLGVSQRACVSRAIKLFFWHRCRGGGSLLFRKS